MSRSMLAFGKDTLLQVESQRTIFLKLKYGDLCSFEAMVLASMSFEIMRINYMQIKMQLMQINEVS